MVEIHGKLGEILIKSGLITEEQLSLSLEAQKESGKRLGQILLEKKMITEEELAKTLASQKDLEVVNLSDYDVSVKAASLIPERVARRYMVLPIDIRDKHLIMAMANPLDVRAIDDVSMMTGHSVTPVVATESDLNRAINQYLVSERSVQDVVESAEAEVEEVKREKEAREVVEEVPIVKLVNRIILQAVHQEASDVHLEPQEKRLKVRYRIDGVLKNVMDLPRRIQPGLISRLKIMGDMDITERRIPQDGRATLRVSGREIDLRMATLPSIFGENVSLRILDKGQKLLTLEGSGFEPQFLSRYRNCFNRPYGAVLVTGPTGSGKTTTLYATLNELNSPDKKIITIEDPVEYEMEGLVQVPVNPKAGITFAKGLRSIVRSDPDIIMVGEIRDIETAQIFIHSSLTGHLVLSTLHTNDAPSAVTRLIDMGVEPFLISTAVEGVVAQRLVRRLCEHCREAIRLSSIMPVSPEEDFVVYKAKGCRRCAGTGYGGRVALFELMVVTDQIGRACVEGKSADEIRRVAISQGMKTLLDDGMEKIKKGITSMEEVMRVVS